MPAMRGEVCPCRVTGAGLAYRCEFVELEKLGDDQIDGSAAGEAHRGEMAQPTLALRRELGQLALPEDVDARAAELPLEKEPPEGSVCLSSEDGREPPRRVPAGWHGACRPEAKRSAAAHEQHREHHSRRHDDYAVVPGGRAFAALDLVLVLVVIRLAHPRGLVQVCSIAKRRVPSVSRHNFAAQPGVVMG